MEPGLRHGFRSQLWGSAPLRALPVATLVLGLFNDWFAVPDRYTVFLYYHSMGHRVPDKSPFGGVTSGRYWMAGLVAGGAVVVLHAATRWLVRDFPGYRAPQWRSVWLLTVVRVGIGIPTITMIVNQPTLRLVHALCTTLIAWLDLALELMRGAGSGRPR